MATLTLDKVEKRFGNNQVIHGVSIDIADGEFIVIVGPSGCGKSTLLRMVAGLESVSAGEISIGGERVNDREPMDRNIAMVFQNYALYPHMSVRQNMAYGLKIARVPKPEIETKVAAAAKLLQLEPYLDRKPRQLSGGQRQRVAMGRAIVRDPQVFLFDEPLSNLDAKLRIQMRVELEALHEDLGATMIYVTHDQVEAMTMADKIVVLNEGRVEQIGAPLELYHRPRTAFVAGFIGAPSMNFLDVSDEAGVIRYGGAELARRDGGGTTVRLGVRPEHVTVAASGAASLDANVMVKEALGGESYLYVTTEQGDRLVVKTDGDHGAAAGDRIGLVLPPARLHFFGADGNALETGQPGGVPLKRSGGEHG